MGTISPIASTITCAGRSLLSALSLSAVFSSNQTMPASTDSPTGPTAASRSSKSSPPRSSKSPSRTKEAAATAAEKAAVEADALPVALPAPSPARNAYHGALLVMSTVIGTLAAVLTSTTFATILNLAPHGDDNWGLKCTATALRLAVLTLSLLRSEPSTPIAVLVGVARLLTGVAVELCILFAQPIYATYSGGIFKPGDVSTGR